MNDNIGGDVRNNQGQHHGCTKGVRCGAESFGERHGDDDLVDDPFDRVDITVRVFAPSEGDPGLHGL